MKSHEPPNLSDQNQSYLSGDSIRNPVSLFISVKDGIYLPIEMIRYNIMNFNRSLTIYNCENIFIHNRYYLYPPVFLAYDSMHEKTPVGKIRCSICPRDCLGSKSVSHTFDQITDYFENYFDLSQPMMYP